VTLPAAFPVTWQTLNENVFVVSVLALSAVSRQGKRRCATTFAFDGQKRACSDTAAESLLMSSDTQARDHARSSLLHSSQLALAFISLAIKLKR
jgi:hypothetical protein